MLTAADVEQKTFSTALRGYDLDEVDDFLDEIVATIRQLNEQLDEARVAAAEAPAVIAPIPEPEPVAVIEPEPEPEPAAVFKPEPEPEPAVAAPTPEIDESAIGRALLAAQNAADNLLAEARDQAGKLVEEAKTEADSWTEEREAKRREAEAEISRLATRVASVRSELSVLAGEVSGKLDEMDSVIDDAGDTDTGPVGEGDGGGGDSEDESIVVAGYEDAPETHDEPADTGADRGHEISAEAGPSDHLDEMLNGVVNDLQLSSDEPEEGAAQPDDEDLDDPDDHWENR
jgi:DivIVA domain-containing protein